MIELELAHTALSLTLSLLWPAVLVAILAGVLAGVVRAFFNIDDDILGLAFRSIALLFLVYLSGALAWQEIEDFSARVWAGSDIYH